MTIVDGVPAKTGVKIISSLHNDRSDPTVYPPRTQELPATYTNGAYSRLFAYTGPTPFANGNLTEFQTGFRGPGAPGGAWIPGEIKATENWAALVDSHGWGMGVVNPGTSTILGGFSGEKKPGGTADPQVFTFSCMRLPSHFELASLPDRCMVSSSSLSI